MTTTYLFGHGTSNASHTLAQGKKGAWWTVQRQAVSMIKSFFAKYTALIGKPVFTVTNDKVTVQVFYYTATDSISNASINALGNALTRCFGRIVELRLIRLNHAALDSSIFAQYLSLNSNKYSFNRLFDILKASLPTVALRSSLGVSESDSAGSSSASHSLQPSSTITGIKVKLSGRLTTQRSVPRQTTNANRLGSSVSKNSGGAVDFNQHTAKNKLGAFTMKVWISQQSMS